MTTVPSLYTMRFCNSSHTFIYWIISLFHISTAVCKQQDRLATQMKLSDYVALFADMPFSAYQRGTP